MSRREQEPHARPRREDPDPWHETLPDLPPPRQNDAPPPVSRREREKERDREQRDREQRDREQRHREQRDREQRDREQRDREQRDREQRDREQRDREQRDREQRDREQRDREQRDREKRDREKREREKEKRTSKERTKEAVLQTEKLLKIYGGRAVVNGVDINVSKGEIVGLLGPNGAGKTTSFYMIVGLVHPNGGRIFFCGHDITGAPMHRRARMGLGYLPQEESIFRKLTVEQNLLAILETLPLSRAERERRCEQLLNQFGIEHLRRNVALTLSGGEKRRLTIARSLVTQPSLIMLDEPFSGVDPIAVWDIQQIILNLRDSGYAILITDHNVRETLSIVDRAYLIFEGRVESQGTKDFLINDPVSRQLYLGERFSM